METSELEAEIKRLKAENEITVRVCNENTDLKRLIIELCDAMEDLDPGYDRIKKLIQQGREATR